MFAFRRGVVDDARACLEVDAVRFGDQRADGDARVHIAREVEVADGAGVDSPAVGLEGGDELACADLRRAGDGPGRETRAQSIEGVETRCQLRVYVGDDVHDVGVSLDMERVVHGDGADGADAAKVVASEVDEHSVFSELLVVVEQLAFERGVFEGRSAARASSGYGAHEELIAFQPDEDLG